MFEIVNVTDRSVTIKFNNNECYKQKDEYEIYIDRNLYKKSNKNVISIYGLNSDQEYEILAKTKAEEYSSNISTKTYTEIYKISIDEFNEEEKDDCTNFVQDKIDKAQKGSLICFDGGLFNLRNLYLKDDLDLYIDKEATLNFIGNRENLDILKSKGDEIVLWEGTEDDVYASIINVLSSKNITIFGQGTIEGNGSFDYWWDDVKVKRGSWRPYLIHIINSKNISMYDVKLKNSPSWTVHPILSTNLKFINIKINNPHNSPNTDGINPEFCNTVLIQGVKFTLGDDCIALKAGKYDIAKKLAKLTENVKIDNCFMERGHGAVVIGSEMSGGIRNIDISNCYFYDTDRGVRIKTRRGRGGKISNIRVNNIFMDAVLNVFVINNYYFCDEDGKTEYVYSKEKYPVTEETPIIEGVVIENVEAINTKVSGIYIYGLPELPVDNVELKNIKISFCDEDYYGYPAMLSFQEKVTRKATFLRNIYKLIIENNKYENYLGEEFDIDESSSILEN